MCADETLHNRKMTFRIRVRCAKVSQEGITDQHFPVSNGLAHVTPWLWSVCAGMDWLLLLPLFLIPLQGEPAVIHLASETTQSCVSVRPQGLLQTALGIAAKVFLSGTRGILVAKSTYRSLSTACLLFIRNIAIGPLLNSPSC